MKKVVFPLRLRMRRPEVGDLHQVLALTEFEVADTEVTSHLYGASTQEAVRKLQAAHQLEVTGVVDEATANLLNRLLAERGALEDDAREGEPTYEVKGMVRDADGKGIAGLTVSVYELLLRERRPLAQGKTFRNGFYELRYRAPQVRGRSKKDFAIVVVVVRQDRTEWVSKPIYKVDPLEWVNFFEGSGEYPGESEYDQVLERILATAADVPLRDLVETEERKEISYLAGRTGLDAQEIMLVVMAHHLAGRTKLEPEAFYGLFKQRLPHNLPESLLARTFGFTMLDQLVGSLLDGILALNDETIRRALRRAVEANHVPLPFGKRIDAVVGTLQEQRLARTLDQPNLLGKTSLRSMLGATKLNQDHFPLFAKLYAEYGGTTARFWKALDEQRDTLGSDVVDDSKLTFDLGLKIQNYLPLLTTLKASLSAEERAYPGKLAMWTPEQWEEKIRASTTAEDKGYPPNIDGDDEDEKIRTYAASLTERFERAYPTMALLRHISQAEPPALEHKAEVLRFFTDNPDIDLRTAQLDPRLRENQAAREIRMLQRSLQLAPNASAATALLTTNYHSAQRIYAAGKSRFARHIEKAGISKTQAEKMYANAELKYAMVLAGLMEYSLDFNRVLPGAILPTITPEIIKGKNIEEDYPSLRGLFGSLDWCACEHCQSVYSPAAYLVDVLAFLKERQAKTVGWVKDVLFERRPDIGDIDLNCANTNTPLPYIDLVNEVLEDAVAPPALRVLPRRAEPELLDGLASVRLREHLTALGIDISDEATVTVIEPGQRWAIRDRAVHYKVIKTGGQLHVKLSRQTLGTAAELRAHPEYVNGPAYATLRRALFPMRLPFDLWWEEARVYLRQLDIQRHDVMKAYQDRRSALAVPASQDIAAEFFGISTAEAAIIAKAEPAKQATYWGTADPVVELATVATFLRQAGFLLEQGNEYRTLVELLAARFVNPPDDLSEIQRGQEPCNTEQQTITNLSPEKLDRAHRFLRLWRRSGWSMWELDLLIGSAAVGDKNLNADCIARLCSFKELQEKLKLSVERLLAFYESLNTETREILGEREEPLYAQLFLNKAIVNPLNAAFEVSKVTVRDTTIRMGDHTATILSGLLISEEDFSLLAAKTDGGLTLNNLSLLYRYATLARALKLTVKDLLLLLDLTGVGDPFAGLAETEAFLKLFDAIREARFSIRELEYLLTFSSDSPLGLSAEVATRYLTQVRGDLEKAPDVADERDKVVMATLSNLLKIEAKQAQVALEKLQRNGQPLIAYFRDANLVARDATTGDYKFPLSDQSLAVLFECLHQLHKVAVLIGKLKLTAERLEWLLDHAADYGGDVGNVFVSGLDFNTLPVKTGEAAVPFHSWLFLAQLVEFNDRYPEREGLSLLSILEGLGAAPTLDATLYDLARWTQWERGDLADIHAMLNLQHPDDYRDVQTYRRVAECVRYARRAGVKAQTLTAWRAAVLTDVESDQIKQAVKAKYATEAWLQVSEALQDEIREKKRAGLVDYLVAHPRDRVPGNPSQGKAWDDANGLFAYFLVDVEMSACQPTSRIKQAAGAAQLFVQRCFLNLEPDVVVDALAGDGDDTCYDEDWLQWKWRKNYRVWEANRKVFLYPENWIEPELRDDKSPFFRELEDELQQNEVTDAYVEDVFLNYLAKLDDVARLEVVGMCQDAMPDGKTTLHVIARTRATPHIYYHREWVNGAYWTAWKKIDVEIQGGHAVPAVYNRKLHLFWLVFSEKPEQNQPVPAVEASPVPPPEPKKYLEIQLAWSIYRHGKWSPKKVSRAKLIHPWPRPDYSYSMQLAEDSSNNLNVHLFVSTSQEFNDATTIIKDQSGNPAHARKYPYVEQHSEAARPWHSSTFVFDGDVIEVGLVDMGGWYNVVHANYGEDGRATVPINWPRPSRRLARGLHYKFNLLANNLDVLNDDLYVVVLDNRLINGEVVLENIPTPFRVVVPSDSLFFDSSRVFFFQDEQRTHFVVPNPQYSIAYDSSGQIYVPDITRHTFYQFYHPYTTLFTRELNRLGLAGLLNRRVQVEPASIDPVNDFDFDAIYHPHKPYVCADQSEEIVDFSPDAAYSLYNWELFFHAPLLIACRLSQNQRFEEALRWFHFIFDPTNPSKEETPRKYWITQPFYEHNREDYRDQKIEELLKSVNAGVKSYVDQVEDWQDNPFQPHRIARLRDVAYQWTVVMKYLDSLIAWGDQLFRRDTIESINEATQLYILAAEILGPRPVQVPAVDRRVDRSFDDIEWRLDAFSNVLEDLENQMPVISQRGSTPPATEKLPHLHTFFFCIPPNEKLLSYWDTVAKRLFRVRHCMNIEGVVRQLPLFEPPIDPAVLVKAAAAGVDIGSVLGEVSAPLPHYRFPMMLQKAHEFCNDVKGLGNALLAALEKKDAEVLALLRSTHEIKVLEATKRVREQQIAEAWETITSLEKTKNVAEERKQHYEWLMATGLIGQEIAGLTLSGASLALDDAIACGYVMAGGLALIPSFLVGASGFGGSPHATAEMGQKQAVDGAEAAVKTLSSIAQALDKRASLALRIADYTRRREEWNFQCRLAERDLKQIEKQIDAAMLRWEIAKKEFANIELQIENAMAVDEYMRSKYTNQELYDWMVSQLAAVYFESYKLAYDMARRAERAFQYEIGQYDASFVQFGYWDSLKKGLLAGEKLTVDLRRMEAAYLGQNKREYEITKHISLAQVAPAALMQLKASGTCEIDLPELLFDMDYPGHYFRRVRSVSISIPCVVGPYTGVNCTLTLLKNSVRVRDRADAGYSREPESASGDDRFRDELAAVQSIATSSAREDSGMFELNFRDERYLPFEGAGAISTWRIDLPNAFNYFDFNTISDVVIHLRYTAREGGDQLRQAAAAAVQAALPEAGVQLLDLKRSFSTAWHQFLNPAAGTDQELRLTLSAEHFPFYVRNRAVEVKQIQLLADLADSGPYDVILTPPLPVTTVLSLACDTGAQPTYGALHHAEQAAPAGATYPLGQWTLKLCKQGAADFRSLAADEVRQLFMIVAFSVR